jgi:hypothetical protein
MPRRKKTSERTNATQYRKSSDIFSVRKNLSFFERDKEKKKEKKSIRTQPSLIGESQNQQDPSQARFNQAGLLNNHNIQHHPTEDNRREGATVTKHEAALPQYLSVRRYRTQHQQNTAKQNKTQDITSSFLVLLLPQSTIHNIIES